MAAAAENLNPFLACFLLLLGNGLVLGEFPFRNTSLPLSERVADLVGRLTLEEVVMQMARGGGGKYGGPAPAIPRLGITRFEWDVECLRGDGMAGNATSFPQALGLASAFSPDLMEAVATATGLEVRAKHNDFFHRKKFGDGTGLGCFSPVVNIMRHPLWGRNQETYGEDPYLTGQLARGFIRGLNGRDPRYLATAATCKHLGAYDGPENLPTIRLAFNAKVSERDLRTTFLPQFKACVEGGTQGIMCSYNSINGVPACLDKKFLTDILRKEWGYQGYVVSDSGALEFSILWHHYILSITKTAAAAANAGLNLELGPTGFITQVYVFLNAAVELGEVTEDKLRELVKPLFATRMRLGEFDPPQGNPYTRLNLSIIQSPAHQAVSLRAASQSLVLLKNSGLLPLHGAVTTLAIVGPMANDSLQLMGDYSADVDDRFVVTPLEGLSPLGKKVRFAPGCSDTRCSDYKATEVKDAVTGADVTVVCLGTGQAIETENHDRPNLSLPGQQSQILQDVISHAGGPVVLLVFTGGPIDINLAERSDKVAAILQCHFPAQAAGTALRHVMTLNSPADNPAARLPYTWYASMEQVPDMTDYNMENKTYRYFKGDPLYPFGYGLSYSSFNYSGLDLSPVRVKAGGNVTVTFKVTNLGPYPGDEVSQVYISWLNATVPTPRYQLVGFDRVHVDKGQTVALNFTITASQMAVWIDDNKGFQVEPGEIRVYVGGQLPNQKKSIKSNILTAIFTVY